MSKFWEHYEAAKPGVASAVDDVRHKVVEEGWFGRTTTGDIAPDDKGDGASHLTAGAPHNHSALYEQVWGTAPKTSDLYGHSPAPSKGPEIEAPKPPEKDRGVGPDF